MRDFRSNDKFRKFTCISTTIGVLQFLFMTFLAAVFYPAGYDYFGHYFSDLGAVVARNGETNVISSTLFIIALIVISLTLIPFWMVSSSLFTGSKIEKITSKIGAALGLISTPFIIGIALNPMDTQFELHLLSAMMVLMLFTLATLLYSIAIIINREYSRYLGFLGFVVISFSIGLLLDPLAPHGAFLQKIIFYSYFIWIFIPTFLIWRFIK